ncbi:hypothetical protein SteCoe_32032 [Stentor coeruleus]|uniref:Protein kinase domain-containing protein n=1 Tax=Stentor coeruleus TaxID=5963 RepID=A0A1R2B0B4_9CILI|nr:hypothetical protein SteCoe_32032 [Stentor coeruleus]
MENYYRNFIPKFEMINKSDRAVFLAQSNEYYENCGMPEEFIIKIFKSNSIPLEISLQVELCQKSQNILRVYDFWKRDEYFYLSMEYCSNGDLHKYLIALNGNPLEWSITLQKCYEICSTVNLIHSFGYAHRDIKPLNIYITKAFEFKLADFGEAKYIGKIDGEVDYHTIRGTPFYMSPEVKSRYDKSNIIKNNPFRDDIWGLALTFIEIAMGRLCPEVSKMNSNQCWEFLCNNYQCFGYSEKFVKLIFCMMPADLQNQFYTANQVLEIILELINEFNQYTQSIIPEEPKNESAQVENTDNIKIVNAGENNMKKVSIEKTDDEKKVEIEIKVHKQTDEEYQIPPMPPIATESFRIPQIPPAPVMNNKKKIVVENQKIDESDSDDISDSSDSSNSDDENEKYDKEKSKKIEEIKSNTCYQSRINEKQPFTRVDSEKDDPNLFSTQETKLSHSDKNAVVHAVSFERNDSLHHAQSVPGRNSTKVDNAQSLINSIQIPNPLQSIPQPVILPSIPIGNCSECNIEINENPVKLDCPHLFHRKCFKNHYESIILKAKKPSDIACIKCTKLINIESLSIMHFLEKNVLDKANILHYSIVEVSCPKCGKDLKVTMLNPKNLEPNNVRCKDCDNKICTFCSVIGGHGLWCSCEVFKDFLKSKLNYGNYLRPEKK